VNGATTAFGHDELGRAASTQSLTAKTEVELFLFPIFWLESYKCGAGIILLRTKSDEMKANRINTSS
jgi:hypothetical protein